MKIGIIGGGQLGRMMGLAAYSLGQRVIFLDQDTNTPGGQIGPLVAGAWDDAQKIAELAASCDVLTFDVENVPASAIRALGSSTAFWPPVGVLDISQDRLSEKQTFAELGIPTVAHRAVNSAHELREAVQVLGLPCVLKTRRLGYDGRGQRMLRTREDVEVAWKALGAVDLILEAFVHFSHEVSIIGARNPQGDTRTYPLVHNTHRDGILIQTVAPHDEPALHAHAQDYLHRVMQHFEYVGVLTIEFFVDEGTLIANEMAPRVHNSGHWSIEGAVTSQFENHIRAIANLPLGDTHPIGHSAMVNFLGQMPAIEAVLNVPGAHYHDYGKSPRPGRKLGHATVTGADVATRDERLQQVLALAEASTC